MVKFTKYVPLCGRFRTTGGGVCPALQISRVSIPDVVRIRQYKPLYA